MGLKKYNVIVLTLIFISGQLVFIQNRSFSSESGRVAIVVSKRIKPYMSIVEGMTEEMGGKKIGFDVFFLPEADHQTSETGTVGFEDGDFVFFAAIGPEATALVWEKRPHDPKLYVAVLDPENLLKNGALQCGISLRIPIESQIREISGAFPNIRRIGLLFDARHNAVFYEAALQTALEYGVRLTPLQVGHRNQITDVLDRNWENLDCIWMIPDETVISEKIIQHIIKLAVYHSKGVIGYNSFFIRSGAFFAFDFDYRALGVQTACKIDTYFETGVCRPEPPVYQILINPKMIEKIGFQAGD